MIHFQAGDRVKLASMKDPSPIPVGTCGTVLSSNAIGNPPDDPVQYSIKWDAPHDRRSLMAVCPPDVLEKA